MHNGSLVLVQHNRGDFISDCFQLIRRGDSAAGSTRHLLKGARSAPFQTFPTHTSAFSPQVRQPSLYLSTELDLVVLKLRHTATQNINLFHKIFLHTFKSLKKRNAASVGPLGSADLGIAIQVHRTRQTTEHDVAWGCAPSPTQRNVAMRSRCICFRRYSK